ncbi:hypothetical protein CUMW_111500 [Citrus unshiu]|nr:hypothetical protein CUMW_111500 [Citrus unshiu]
MHQLFTSVLHDHTTTSLRGNAGNNCQKGCFRKNKSYGKVVPWLSIENLGTFIQFVYFVTHCGWNSTIEAITARAMVCRPVFADQALNQRIIETAWGIGVGVEGEKFTKDETVNALKQVLSSEEGKRMRENVGALKKLAFKAAESDGSSTKNFKALVEVVNMT